MEGCSGAYLTMRSGVSLTLLLLSALHGKSTICVSGGANSFMDWTITFRRNIDGHWLRTGSVVVMTNPVTSCRVSIQTSRPPSHAGA